MREFVRYPKEDKKIFTELTNQFKKRITQFFGLECIDGGSRSKYTLVQSDLPDTDTLVIFPFTFPLQQHVSEWSSTMKWTLSYPAFQLSQLPGENMTKMIIQAFAPDEEKNGLLYPELLIQVLKFALERILEFDKSFFIQYGEPSDIVIKKRCLNLTIGGVSFDFVPSVRPAYQNKIVDGVLVPFSYNVKQPYTGNSINWRLNFPAFNRKALLYLTKQYDYDVLHVIQFLKYINGTHKWDISSYALECLVVMKEAELPWAFHFYFPNERDIKENKDQVDFNQQFWFVFNLLVKALSEGNLPQQHSSTESFVTKDKCKKILLGLITFEREFDCCRSDEELKRFLQGNFYTCCECKIGLLPSSDSSTCPYCALVVCRNCAYGHVYQHHLMLSRYGTRYQ